MVRSGSIQKQALALTEHGKGDLISVHGRLQVNTWEKQGEKVEQLQIMVESIVSSRLPKPGRKKQVVSSQSGRASYSMQQPKRFSDEMPARF